MKTSSILCIALLVSSVGAWAQGPGGQRPLFDFRKKNVDAETKAKAVDTAKTIIKAVPDEVKDKAKELMLSPESADMRQKALQAAQALMQNVTDAPKTVAPTPAAASPAVPVVEAPPPPVGPQPKPLQPMNLDEVPRATKGQILITAQKSAFFDANLGYGMYTGDVKARHPQMYIECEELELYMAKQGGGVLSTPKPKTVSPMVKDSDILAPARKEANGPPPIEKAYARGPMVTIEKIAEDGELQVGRCKDLFYDGKTDTTTLRDWPQVQAGNKLHQATEPGCVMIIDKGGKLTTTGGHRTIILQGDEASPQSRTSIVPTTPASAPAPQ